MKFFLNSFINPIRLRLLWDSAIAFFFVIITLCFSFWLFRDYKYLKFAFIFSLQLVYAKSDINIKKRLPLTLFWSVCLGIALSIVPLLSGLLIAKSSIILVTIIVVFSLKEKYLLFDNNIANQFVLDFCVFLFLVPPGNLDLKFLIVSIICGVISIIRDQFILSKKMYRMVKLNLLRSFIKIPKNLKKLSKKARNIQKYKQKENYFFYIETINEIQELENVLIPDKKQKIFYTKLIFFTASALRALKIIETNLYFCSKDFNNDISYILKHFALTYQKLSAYILHNKVIINKIDLQKLCQKYKKKYTPQIDSSQAKILVSLERLSTLIEDIYRHLENESK